MQIKMLSFQKHKRMSLVQYLSADKNTFDYISGPAALNQKAVQVKEVSQAGNVNELIVYNLSDKFVFFMDGDILTGAKQNRVLNSSVLLSPNSKVNLPVSCVEQGRWDNYTSDFRSSENIAPVKLRANKAKDVKESQERREGMRTNQMNIWNDVEEYAFRLKSSSPTMNLNFVYEKNVHTFENFMSNFSIHPDANGMAVFTDNKLLCLDLFNRTEIYNEYFPKLLKSTAMEIAHLEEKVNETEEAEAFYKTLSVLDAAAAGSYTSHKGIGVGEEKRFSTENITGFLLGYNNLLIHLTALNIEKHKDSTNDYPGN